MAIGTLIAGVAAAGAGIYGAVQANKAAKKNSAMQAQQMQFARERLLPGGNEAANTVLGQMGQYDQYADNIANNPYGQSALGSAEQAGGYGNQMMGAGMSLVPYAQQMLEMGFDPQEAYYNRAVQRMQDQTRVGQSARGVVMSPYGAMMESNALGNFNLDWQNTALQRANQGAQGAAGLLNQAGDTLGQGYAMSQLPYANYLGQQNDAMSGLNTAINPYLQYLGLYNQSGATATGGQQSAMNFGLNSQKQANEQMTGAMNQIGSGWGDIAGGVPKSWGWT